MPAMRIPDLLDHGGLHVRRERLIEPVTLDQCSVERRQALPAHGPAPLGIEVRDDDRQTSLERRLRDRFVHRPLRPARRLPVHCLPEPGGITRPRGEVTGEGVRLRRREHLERDGRPAPGRRERAEQSRLEHMVIGVVVLLAEQHVPRVRDPRGQGRLVHEPAGRHVPDPADQSMLTTDGGLPGRAGDGGAAGREQRKQRDQRQDAS